MATDNLKRAERIVLKPGLSMSAVPRTGRVTSGPTAGSWPRGRRPERRTGAAWWPILTTRTTPAAGRLSLWSRSPPRTASDRTRPKRTV